MGYVIVLYLYLRAQTAMMDVDQLQVDGDGGVLQVEVHPPNTQFPTLEACQAALKSIGAPDVGYPYKIANSWCKEKRE
ncbi:MAG TPA: hypothetical protein VGV09_20710 [Steroidobacteraceae bacterium]|nr:hypothetical protein [Steroidobacteraceae bacterium]